MNDRILRTPDARFTDLPDFDFEPHYVDVETPDFPAVRMAWVEAGPADGPVVLLLHGEPSWSFLYRKMIPIFAEAGFRTIAPDLIGFGRSDKPVNTDDYTYARHTDWMRGFIETLDLRGIHMVCQDWGGLLGLRLLAEMSGRFAAVVASNTMLPTGHGETPESFLKWRGFSQKVPEFPVSGVLDMATETQLSDEVKRAYDAPFPDESYKAGARIFPVLVPIDPEDPEGQRNKEAWKVIATSDVPFLVAFGDSDAITGPAAPVLRERVAGAQGQPHCTIEGAGHFIQEDRGEELARVARDFFDRVPSD